MKNKIHERTKKGKKTGKAVAFTQIVLVFKIQTLSKARLSVTTCRKMQKKSF